MAPGKHVIEVSAPGFETQSQAITVTGREPVSIVFKLQRSTAPRSRSSTNLIGGGVALGIGAAIYYVVAAKPLRDELATTTDRTVYDDDRRGFIVRRDVSIGFGVAAAATVAVGVVHRYALSARDSSASVSAQLGRDGAFVGVGWAL